MPKGTGAVPERFTKRGSKCIQNAAADEPLFVLRGQDLSSPKVVLHWIAKNFENVPDEKLRDAFEVAMSMKNWPRRKTAD